MKTNNEESLIRDDILEQFDPSTNQNIIISAPPVISSMGMSFGFWEFFPMDLLEEMPRGENGEYIIDPEHPMVKQLLEDFRGYQRSSCRYSCMGFNSKKP
jgi:hypothetical protein